MTTVRTYTGVWRPGKGIERWFAGSFSDFKDEDTKFFAKGLRLAAVDRHADQVFAAWRPGSGTQWCTSNASISSFKAKDAKYVAQGLRLVSIDMSEGKVTAVWQPGTGTQYWASGLTLSEFSKKDADYFAKGLHLKAVDIDAGKYFGVWRSGKGPQRWVSGSYELIKSRNAEFMKQGLCLDAIDRSGDQFIGVWHAGTGAAYWYTGLTMKQFEKKEAEYRAKGLRLVAVDSGTYSVKPPTKRKPPSSTTTWRNLVLHRDSGRNPGAWFNYVADVPNDPLIGSKKIHSIKNNSNFEIRLSHDGASTIIGKHSTTDDFNTQHYAGHWNAELIDTAQAYAPPLIGVDVYLV